MDTERKRAAYSVVVKTDGTCEASCKGMNIKDGDTLVLRRARFGDRSAELNFLELVKVYPDGSISLRSEPNKPLFMTNLGGRLQLFFVGVDRTI